MPQLAQPKPVEAPHGFVQSAGNQDDFAETAKSVAASLGWQGDPSWVAGDIAVADAVGFIQKTLHEAFIAGAKGGSFDGSTAANHLGLSGPELALFFAATGTAFNSGVGAPLTQHAIVRAPLGQVSLVIPLTDGAK
jgi:hypothetical protein